MADAGEIVRQTMEDTALRTDLERPCGRKRCFRSSLPMGLAAQAEAYVASVRDPFLKHRLADIADNHQAKKVAPHASGR